MNIHDGQAAAERWGVGRGCPPPLWGMGLGRRQCPLPRKKFDFVSKNGDF